MAELDTNVSTETSVEAEAETTAEAEATESADISRLKAEMARQKAALDKATSEAAAMKKQLRAKQSAEGIAAEEKRMQDEERDRKLAEYEKRFFVAETSKKVLKFTGDEAVSDAAAEYLFGAADVDGVIDVLQKAWTAKETRSGISLGKKRSGPIGPARRKWKSSGHLRRGKAPLRRKRRSMWITFFP